MALNKREPRVGELRLDPKRPGVALVERAWLSGADGPINAMCVREFGPAPGGQGMQWNAVRATDAQMQAAGLTSAQIAQANASFVQHTTATKQPKRASSGSKQRRSTQANPAAGATTPSGATDVYADRRAELQISRGRDPQFAYPSTATSDPAQIYAQRKNKGAEIREGEYGIIKPAWRNGTE